MRRDRIIKAVNNLRDALQAAQIRELLRGTRNGQNGQSAEGVSRTQKILLAYNVFMRHYQDFSDDEKDMMTFFGLTPLLDTNFWSSLIDSEQGVSRKLLTDVDVGAYNVIFVMPKLRDLLARDNDRERLMITDDSGSETEIKRLRLLIAERERALTDPHTVINVMRSMDELYECFTTLRGEGGAALSIGAIDSGSTKSFDFFGGAEIMNEIALLLINVWDRIKYAIEDNFRYQIEVAMMAAGFIGKVKDAQSAELITEEQGQRMTRSVAKAIETLFRSGAYTEDMDEVREVRASEFLSPKTQLLEYRREERPAEAKAVDTRDPYDAGFDKSDPLARLTQDKEPKEIKDIKDAAKDPLKDIKEAVDGSASGNTATY